MTATEGQPLKNINIFSSQSDPIALSSSEYPDWLAKELERPERLDPYKFQKDGRIPTRTELRLITKALIRQSNEENAR